MSRLTVYDYDILKALLKNKLVKNNLDVLHELRGIQKAKFLFEKLSTFSVEYEICIKHKVTTSCEESLRHYKRFERYLGSDYSVCKHLLLKEKKEDRVFLVIIDMNKIVDIKKLREILECKKLEFISIEEMSFLLKTTPGNISIFNLINEKNQKIELLFDQELLKFSLLAFHPLYNGMSLFIKPVELDKFLKAINRNIVLTEVPCQEKQKTYTKVL